jgi:hypothetical protein
MNIRKILGAISLALLVALCFTTLSSKALAQSSDVTQADKPTGKDDETNLDTQLYLIVATNQDVADARLPASLDRVIKELRVSLPFKNYRLAATLVNRVKNEGRLDLRWIGGAFAAPVGSASQVTPSFSEFKVGVVKLVRNSEGQPMVQMTRFSYGARIPIQTGTAIASNGSGFPSINYESTGLNTDISMREGVAVVVGTLNAGPSGDAIILVVSAKRTQQ